MFQRILLLLALLAAASASRAQDIPLPSIPKGGLMHVEISLASVTGQALPGIPITLGVPGQCGSLSTGEAVTDAAGVFRFDFRAGATPGACRIEGRNANVVAYARTVIYDPAEVTVAVPQPLLTVPTGYTALYSVAVTARGLALSGLPVTAELVVDGESTATAINVFPSNHDGRASVFVDTNGVPGIFDVVIRVAGASRRVRVWQQLLVLRNADPPGQSLRLEGVPDGQGPIRMSIVDAVPTCIVEEAVYIREYPRDTPPEGTIGFPKGLVQARLNGCTGSVRLRLEYPTALPASGYFMVNAPTPANPQPYTRVPSAVNGGTVEFTLVEGGLGDRPDTPNGFQLYGGLAQPGTRPTPRPIPAVRDMWWSGPAENGWGISVLQSGNLDNLFSVIYAYGDDGRPTWWVMPGGSWDQRNVEFETSTYSPRGTPWYAFDPSLQAVGAQAGTARFSFADENHATFDFTINGVTGRKALERTMYGPVAASPMSNLGGMWWGGIAQSGWGVAILQQHATLFSVWFTYDERNRPTWFLMPGGQWTSADTYEGRMFRTLGSPWLGRAYDASKLQVIDVGAYRLKFGAANATFDYSIEGRAGTLALTRNAPF